MSELKQELQDQEKKNQKLKQENAALQEADTVLPRPGGTSHTFEAVLTISMIQKIATQWCVDQDLHSREAAAIQRFIEHLKVVTP